MPITYGRNLARLSQPDFLRRHPILEKAYTSHSEKSDVFLSYHRRDQDTAFGLAATLNDLGRNVYIDIHDSTLNPGDVNLENALLTAIRNSDTMVIIISDNTQASWWVPWEIGVSTPSRKPKALFKPTASKALPDYLARLKRLVSSTAVNRWVLDNKQ